MKSLRILSALVVLAFALPQAQSQSVSRGKSGSSNSSSRSRDNNAREQSNRGAGQILNRGGSSRDSGSSRSSGGSSFNDAGRRALNLPTISDMQRRSGGSSAGSSRGTGSRNDGGTVRSDDSRNWGNSRGNDTKSNDNRGGRGDLGGGTTGRGNGFSLGRPDNQNRDNQNRNDRGNEGRTLERPRVDNGSMRTLPGSRDGLGRSQSDSGRGARDIGSGIIRGGDDQNDRGWQGQSGATNNGGTIRGGSTSGRTDNWNYRNAHDKGEPIKIGRAPRDRVRGNNNWYGGYRPSYYDGYALFGPSFSVRIGYTHYDYRWRDTNFFYGYYVNDPCLRPSFVSPWYYYPHLPAYVVADRCTVSSILPPVFVGTSYDWYRPSQGDRYGRSATDLDYAVDDLITAFEKNNRRAKNRLIPDNGSVNILIDGEYSYSLSPDDFEDMFSDAIADTRTSQYDIVDVRYNSREARVVARHEYEDPWGARKQVWHTYRLSVERGGAVIREFGVSDFRP